jgi:hypothetical protein
MPIPIAVRTSAQGRNRFIWHDGTDGERGYSNVIGCRDHIGLQVWQDPATRRLVVTVESVEGVNRFGGYTVRYLFNAETGPFDDQGTLVESGLQVMRASLSHLMEVEAPK